jgi:hypothetical protein
MKPSRQLRRPRGLALLPGPSRRDRPSWSLASRHGHIEAATGSTGRIRMSEIFYANISDKTGSGMRSASLYFVQY